jgi:ElaB/YqjD/DUF883 family membrane-anchored ribosome-binding protein
MDTDAKTQVADVVDSAREKTQKQASDAVDKGRGALRSQVDMRSTQAGEQAQSIAETLRQTAMQLRQSGDDQKGRYAKIADQGADRLERVGGYLTDSDAEELLSKVEDVARRQPWLVVGTGLILGLATARFLKASSTERYYRQRRLYDAPPPPSWESSASLTELEATRPPALAPTV